MNDIAVGLTGYRSPRNGQRPRRKLWVCIVDNGAAELQFASPVEPPYQSIAVGSHTRIELRGDYAMFDNDWPDSLPMVRNNLRIT